MKAVSERTTWPLWECLQLESLVKLIQYQWDNYGLKLELLIDIYREMESLEEIDRLMRQKPHYPKGVKWRG